MYNKVEEWLDNILLQEIPDAVIALNFNLYENSGNNWSIELVGTERFDLEDEDWACDEIFDFGTRVIFPCTKELKRGREKDTID